MKINKWVFFYLLVLLTVNACFNGYFSFLSLKNSPNKPETAKSCSSLDNDYGCSLSGFTPNGQVFVSAMGFGKSDSVFCSFADPDSKLILETVKMTRYGNHYFGQPSKSYRNVSFWFFQKYKDVPWAEFKCRDIADKEIINFRIEKNGSITRLPN